MTAAFKRTVVLLIEVLVLEVLVFSSLILTAHGETMPEDMSVMEVSDIAYEPVYEISGILGEKAVTCFEMEGEFDVAGHEETDVASDVGSVSDEDYQLYVEDYGYYGDGDVVYSYAGDEAAYSGDGGMISGAEFQQRGVYNDGEYSYTYYSENVLPGGGLDIPGRHVGDEGYVVDGDGNLCVASDDLPYGAVVDVPFGTGTAVVYDTGSGYGNLDVYVSW